MRLDYVVGRKVARLHVSPFYSENRAVDLNFFQNHILKTQAFCFLPV